MGLSLVLGLWDLPELCFSIPVRGEAQMKMTQSGIQADGAIMGGGRISLLDDLGQITQLATRIAQPQVPACNSPEVSPESEVPQH